MWIRIERTFHRYIKINYAFESQASVFIWDTNIWGMQFNCKVDVIGSNNVHSNIAWRIYVCVFVCHRCCCYFHCMMHLKMFKKFVLHSVLWVVEEKDEECWTIFVVSVLLYHQSCHVQLHTCIWLYFIRTNLSVCRSVYRCVYSPSNKIVNIYASNLNRFRRYNTDFVLCFMFRTYSLSLFWSVFLSRNVSIWLYSTYICVSCFKTLLTRLLAFHLVLFSSLAYICCFHDFMRSFWNLV